MNLVISEIDKNDLALIIDLAERTNELQVIPCLNQEGKNAMRAARKKDMETIMDKNLYQSLKAVNDDIIVGYISWREGHFITQLYVEPSYQGKGIGRQLVKAVISKTTEKYIRLRSSVNAIGFYKNIGFIETGKEQSIKGIRFIPMELQVEE